MRGYDFFLVRFQRDSSVEMRLTVPSWMQLVLELLNLAKDLMIIMYICELERVP